MKSLYDRFASSDDGAQLLAAARLRREVLRILHRALEASGLTQSQLAERLHVRKSAVSQVFRGDGNLRVTTMANYLSAMGYELDIRLVEAGEPRKAVLEGREMVPALKQDWVESRPSNPSSEVAYSDDADHRYVPITSEPLEARFMSNHLTTMMVEMRMAPAQPSGGALYAFRGYTAEVTMPDISPDQEFHPIRSGATS
ncbi:helix-turn-helix domain-containing protein [Streptomyces coriariae]|uniref:helix-turn-helix domain-containing protein n=1 Tax=Streptomyces coriariae TaxID=2864460 RepID=UPI001E650F77|nr:helix-turn-helix transcriptional regulator [Streptomyces coriariae]